MSSDTMSEFRPKFYQIISDMFLLKMTPKANLGFFGQIWAKISTTYPAINEASTYISVISAIVL